MSKRPWIGPSNQTGYLTANHFHLMQSYILMNIQEQTHQGNVEHSHEICFFILSFFPATQLSVLAPVSVRRDEAPSLSAVALKAHHKVLHANATHVVLIVYAYVASPHTNLTASALEYYAEDFPVPSSPFQELLSTSQCP